MACHYSFSYKMGGGINDSIGHVHKLCMPRNRTIQLWYPSFLTRGRKCCTLVVLSSLTDRFQKEVWKLLLSSLEWMPLSNDSHPPAPAAIHETARSDWE